MVVAKLPINLTKNRYRDISPCKKNMAQLTISLESEVDFNFKTHFFLFFLSARQTIRLEFC